MFCIFNILEEKIWDISCLTETNGLKYRGYKNTSISGKPCLKWTEVEASLNMSTMYDNNGTPVKLSAINETLDEAENYCRNLLQLQTSEPFCFTEMALSSIEVCNISFCDTSKG